MIRASFVAVGLAVAGCSGRPPVLDPAGPQAARIAGYWWLNFWIAVVVLVAVLAFLVDTAVRRRGPLTPSVAPLDPRAERRVTLGVSAAVGVTALVLIVLVVASAATGRGLRTGSWRYWFPTIEVAAQQWWWAVEYWDPVPAHRIRTANEIHIPVGRAVDIELVTRDVIHSFWIPRLHGKVDLVPGRKNHVRLQADRPGEFRGQCAEYCGEQHAWMRLRVVAQPQAEFDAWLQGQRQAPATPADGAAAQGALLFQQLTCANCHAIAGSPATAQAGPDLSHLASRETIGAGVLANTPENLTSWLKDPQAIKPGNHMPSLRLTEAQLRALVAYLETLR